ncbi:hypothetical protein PoB_000729500 [Plakobranchus ocellatus]|uniref:Uncharacterized protein n=1 Tax=Plakobranchus ocellatus TaxID=259542 RepID=A0AAV3YDL7_9GAST|nr:hypothetical protein PoB_000729500 [Plakobranchus ocellatus]
MVDLATQLFQKEEENRTDDVNRSITVLQNADRPAEDDQREEEACEENREESDDCEHRLRLLFLIFQLTYTPRDVQMANYYKDDQEQKRRLGAIIPLL